MKVDFRDVSHASGVNAVVVSVGTGGGIVAMTEVGIITAGDKKLPHFVSSSQYKKIDDKAPLSSKLEEFKKAIKDGTFDVFKQKRMTIRRAYYAIYGHSPGVKLKCSCKSNKCTNCKCAKEKKPCTSACNCNGNYKNPNNRL